MQSAWVTSEELFNGTNAQRLGRRQNDGALRLKRPIIGGCR